MNQWMDDGWMVELMAMARGKFGGVHISLYVGKDKKANRILIISGMISCKRSKFFFFSISSVDSSSIEPT